MEFSGTTARALGIGGTVVRMDELPKTFQQPTPAEVEDCLCIYKDDLKRIAGRRR